MSLKKCLVSLAAPLRDFDTETVVEAARDYQAQGMDQKAAELKAIADHLRMLQREKKRIEDIVIEAFKASDPEGFQESGAKRKEKPATKAAPTVSKATVFTDEAADRAREILRKKLGNLNAGIDPEVIQAGIAIAGNHIERGARTFAAYARAMIADLGEMVRPYLKSWYMGVKYDPRASAFDGMSSAAEVEAADIDAILDEGEADDVSSPAGTAEPDSGVEPAQDGVVPTAVQPAAEPPARRPGTAGGGARGGRGAAAGGAVVSGDRPAAGGERGNQPFHSENGRSGAPTAATGSDQPGRGADDGRQGAPAQREESQAVGDAVRRTAPKLTLSEKRKAQRDAESIEVIPADPANIAATLPFLLNSQHEDVAFAERRFTKPDGYGALFTNGTGTGKTYLALGVIKRMVKQGKKNGLIVVPSQKIIDDWILSADNLGLQLNRLESTEDKGRGVAITTYANFGENMTLADREYDFVVCDEAHSLMQSENAQFTSALQALRAITLHPDAAYARAAMLHRDLYRQRSDLMSMKKEAEKSGNPSVAAKSQKDLDALHVDINKRIEEIREDIAARQGEARPRALFLSATPFAYEKNVQWAEGYLFEFIRGEVRLGNSNQGGYEQFMVQHFGYRIRYHKLTEPGPEVNRDLMQRQFNTWLRQQGVLSARTLDVDQDYDRKFIYIDSKIGHAIDEGLRWLNETDGGRYRALYDIVRKKFAFLQRSRLLEALKAREMVPYIQKQLDLGRKIVVFYDYNEGGSFDVFDLKEVSDTETGPVMVSYYKPTPRTDVEINMGFATPFQEPTQIELNELIREFRAKRPDLVELNTLANSPLATLKAAFPQAVEYNGNIPPKRRTEFVNAFNNDQMPEVNLILAQKAANAGWSAHDTTGKHPRVLINLGLPTAPTVAIQQEGRIYRVGQASDAMFRYVNTGTSWERMAFAEKMARRAGTAENLAMGEDARGLTDSFIEAFESAEVEEPGGENDGKGGKARDRALASVLTEFERAKTYYYAQLKRNSKTKAAEGEDYFATPEPVGLMMTTWARVRPGESLLEPSAGHGAIARWFPDNHTRTVIEQSSELASKLALVTDAQLVTGRFEEWHIVNKRDVIVMNPPFGQGGAKAIAHLDKAFMHLPNGGRIVALIPTGPAADKRFEKWLYEEEVEEKNRKRRDAHLVADIRLPNITFARVGTQVATHIVIIDKQSDPSLVTNQRSIDLSSAEDIEELFARIENIDGPPRSGITEAARLTQAEIDGAGAGAAPTGAGGERGPAAPVYSNPFEKAPERIQSAIAELNAARDIARGSAKSTMDGAIRDLEERKDIGGALLLVWRAMRQTADTNFQVAAQRAAAILEELNNEQPESAASAPAAAAQGNMQKAEFKHTKTGETVYIAKPTTHLGDDFKAISAVAKGEGGWWNSYASGGAIKGFAFKSESARDAFIEKITPKFSMPAAPRPRGITVATVRAAIAPAVSKVSRVAGLEVTVVENNEALPAFIRARIRPGKYPHGVTVGNQVYLIAGNLSGTREARIALAHEIFGHVGPEAAIDDWAEVSARVVDLEATSRRAKDIADDVRDRYPDADQATFTREFLALAAERVHAGPVALLLSRVRAALRRFLSRMGIGGVLEDADIDVWLADGARYLRTGDNRAGLAPSVAFSTGRDDGLQSEDGDADRRVQEREDSGRLGAGRPAAGRIQVRRARLSGTAAPADWEKQTRASSPGGPKTLFRGATRTLKPGDFGLSSLGKNTGSPSAGLGVWFTVDEREASLYGYLIESFNLDIRNPYYTSHSKLPDFESIEAAYRWRENLRAQGYDSIVLMDREIQAKDQVVVFEPDQVLPIPKDPLQFSMPREQPPLFGEGFDLPSETMFDYLVRNLQDRFRRVKMVQRAIEKAGGRISEETNAYLKEEIFHGKVSATIEAFMTKVVDPLVASMKAANVTLEELDEYLYAKHAPERNARIAEIRKDMQDGGSGMTDQEAADYMAALPPKMRLQLEVLAQRVYAMNRARLDMIEAAGLESPQQIELWRTGYEFYVPLRGFTEDERANESMVSSVARRVGRGFDIRGKESKRALGRRSQADSPLLYSVLQMQETIVRSAKNEVGQAFLKLVLDNPNPDLWTVHTGQWGDYKAAWDAKSGEVVYRRDPLSRLGENVLSVKMDGKEHFIVLEDEGHLLARAFKNLGVDSSNVVIRFLAGYNRYMAAINTSLNPEFVITNFARDLQTAIINLVGEQDAQGALREPQKMGRKVLKDIPNAMRGAFLGLYNKDPGNEWVKWFNEFRGAGGMINFYSLQDLEGLRAEIQRGIDSSRAGAPVRVLELVRTLGKHMANTNAAVENGVRLSTYVNARRAGLSRDQAASLARNVTVNFTRKGEFGTVANSLYLFYNASLQGSVRLLYAVTKSKGVRKILAGIAGSAFAWAILNRLIGGDDDDGENRYDKIPNYIKTRNIVFMRPDGSYWKFPLPYGYNVPWVLGTYLENAIAHPDRKAESAVVLAQAILESFNPIGGLESEDPFKAMAKLASPTIADPWIELAINEDWSGRPIQREQPSWGPPLPDSQLYWSQVTMLSKAVTATLNELTGGNEVMPGAVDINPETLDHLFSAFTGGLGRTIIALTVDLPATAFSAEDIRPGQIPFYRRFRGEPSDSYTYQRYDEIKDSVQLYTKRFKALQQDADTRDQARAYRAENELLRIMEPYVRNSEARLTALYRERKAIERSRLDEETKRLRVKRKEEEIEAVRKRTIGRYNELRQRKDAA